MTEFRSELRDSDIGLVAEKVSRGSFGKYLKRAVLKRVRSFTDREVNFDFPVTALVGPNGGGKTTILGAASLILRSVPPRRFFAKSGKYDASMTDWVIEYDLIETPEMRAARQELTDKLLTTPRDQIDAVLKQWVDENSKPSRRRD